MDRSELVELYYMTSFGNLASILRRGLLSHDRAKAIPHDSIALDSVQQIREQTVVAGRRLHSYVNLYLWARNPMLYLRYTYEGRRDICVLSIDPAVLDLDGVVITDRNATKTWHRAEYAANGGLEIVDRETTFAERWTHTDPFEYERRKTATQAEVLVPDRVPTRYIWGAYLPSRRWCATLHEDFPNLKTRPWPHLFFLGGSDSRGERYEPA
jgi:hypothetical protein